MAVKCARWMLLQAIQITVPSFGALSLNLIAFKYIATSLSLAETRSTAANLEQLQPRSNFLRFMC